MHINQGEPKAVFRGSTRFCPVAQQPGRSLLGGKPQSRSDADRAAEEYRQSIRSGAGFSDAGVRLARLHLAENAYEDAWNAGRFLDERLNDPQAARLLMRIATVTGPDTRLRAQARPAPRARGGLRTGANSLR